MPFPTRSSYRDGRRGAQRKRLFDHPYSCFAWGMASRGAISGFDRDQLIRIPTRATRWIPSRAPICPCYGRAWALDNLEKRCQKTGTDRADFSASEEAITESSARLLPAESREAGHCSLRLLQSSGALGPWPIPIVLPTPPFLRMMIRRAAT